MRFIFFLTRRVFASRKESKGLSLFSVIVTSGIALGVITLIIALSVLNGFEHLLAEQLINLDSHIQIVGFREQKLPKSSIVQNEIKNILGKDLQTITPYISKLALFSHSGVREGVTIRGVPEDYFSNKQHIQIIEGRLKFNSDSSLIIGKTLADRLFLKTGDNVTVFALKDENPPSPDNPPIIEKFTVTGIFESGIAKYDDALSFISLNSARNIFHFGQNEVSGYEIKLKSTEKIEVYSDYLQNYLTYPHYVNSIFRLHSTIFTWIELQKKPIPIVLGLIIIVAVFNIISATLTLVLEKTAFIGLLRALGAKRKTIGSVFLSQGLLLGIIGIISGNILAYILCTIQLKYNIITLPASIYFTSKVPLLMSPWIFLLVSGITLFLSLGVSVLPGYIASKTDPVKAIRFR